MKIVKYDKIWELVESLLFIVVYIYKYATTVDPWALLGLGTLILGAVKNPGIIFDSSQSLTLSFISSGDWFQDPWKILKSMGPQVPYVKEHSTRHRDVAPYPWTSNSGLKTV